MNTASSRTRSRRRRSSIRSVGNPNVAFHDHPRAWQATPRDSTTRVADPHGYAYQDIWASDVVLIAGANPYETQSVFFMPYVTGKDSVVIDPRRTITADYAVKTGGGFTFGRRRWVRRVDHHGARAEVGQAPCIVLVADHTAATSLRRQARSRRCEMRQKARRGQRDKVRPVCLPPTHIRRVPRPTRADQPEECPPCTRILGVRRRSVEFLSRSWSGPPRFWRGPRSKERCPRPLKRDARVFSSRRV